jgi:hypothetical protein
MKILDMIDTENGIAGLLLSIVLLIFLYIILRISEFFWNQYHQKTTKTEEAIIMLTEAVKENTSSINKLDKTIHDFPKMKTDLNHLYSATKMLAGDRWPEIRNEIMSDSEMKGTL